MNTSQGALIEILSCNVLVDDLERQIQAAAPDLTIAHEEMRLDSYDAVQWVTITVGSLASVKYTLDIGGIVRKWARERKVRTTIKDAAGVVVEDIDPSMPIEP